MAFRGSGDRGGGHAEAQCSLTPLLSGAGFWILLLKNLFRNSDAAGRLFARSFPPFYSQQGLDFTLSFLEEIVRAIPCYELKFLPDEEVLGFILKKGHFS